MLEMVMVTMATRIMTPVIVGKRLVFRLALKWAEVEVEAFRSSRAKEAKCVKRWTPVHTKIPMATMMWKASACGSGKTCKRHVAYRCSDRAAAKFNITRLYSRSADWVCDGVHDML